MREGQKSDAFDKYPYEEMEQQSLSVFFEEEKYSHSKLSILSAVLMVVAKSKTVCFKQIYYY